MWEAVKTQLLELLLYLLTALLSVGAAYTITYIRKLQSEAEKRIANEQVSTVLARVWHLVEVGVWATEGAVAGALRQAVAEGRASRDELGALGTELVNDVLKKLDAEARIALAATVGDVRKYVESLIDARLEKLKGEGVIPRVRDLADPKSQPA